MKIKNRILAIPAAAAAIPTKPNRAAIKAMMKNASAQRNISPPSREYVSRKRILALQLFLTMYGRACNTDSSVYFVLEPPMTESVDPGLSLT
jgi:hypothetical protein